MDSRMEHGIRWTRTGVHESGAIEYRVVWEVDGRQRVAVFDSADKAAAFYSRKRGAAHVTWIRALYRFVAAAVMALALLGCSGDGGSSAPDAMPVPTTRAELCYQLANAWCERATDCGSADAECMGSVVAECCGYPTEPSSCQVAIEVDTDALDSCLLGISEASCTQVADSDWPMDCSSVE